MIIYFTNHDYIRFITTAYYYLFYGRHDITVIFMKVVLNTIVISLFYDQKGTIISHYRYIVLMYLVCMYLRVSLVYVSDFRHINSRSMTTYDRFILGSTINI